MEYQLTDLRQQLAEEKALTAQLREQLANSQAQCEEFKQEAMERTNDLNQINAFYTNNDDEESFKKLLGEVVERHGVLVQNLQNANYSLDAMIHSVFLYVFAVSSMRGKHEGSSTS